MRKKYIIAGRIILLVIGYITAILAYGGIQHALLALIKGIISNPASILLYCLLYLVRPFTFIPVGRLSTIAGVFWWWWPWIAIALWGEMLSATVAFKNGRMLWPEWLAQKKEEWFGKFSFMLLRYPTVAVILSRMSPLPDDVVNYGRWMLRIARPTYLWWSLLGNVLFSVLNILMGVQIDPEVLLTEWLSAGINRPIFILTIVIYLIVLLISWLIFRKITGNEAIRTEELLGRDMEHTETDLPEKDLSPQT
jgi:uncharacterized membrane protein YdjX (TVP38/TMEM64 family)